MNPQKIPGSARARRLRGLGALGLFLAAMVAPNPALASDLVLNDLEAPLHPSLISVTYKDKSYVVMGAAAEFPEIVFEGKMKRLLAPGSYQTHLATAYAPGFVTFKDQNASAETTQRIHNIRNSMMGDGSVLGGMISEHGEYRCTLVASEAHADCYLAVLFYGTDAAGEVNLQASAVAFSHVGDIAAGRDTPVKISRSFVPPEGEHYYCIPLIFSKGLEIRTDQSEAASGIFRRQDKAAHAALLERYRAQFPSADRAAIAYLRYPPQLPDGVDPQSLPANLTAKFSVMETGEVDSLELVPAPEPRVAHALHRALNAWLFLPRLKKGEPVRTLVVVPLGAGPS